MSCGCGKKSKEFTPMFSGTSATSIEPSNWGPCFWHFLHTFAERVGAINSDIVIRSQASIFRWIIEHIPTILPCQTCQNHAREYILSNPLPVGLETITSGEALREQVRSWLFHFHSAVRQRIGQSVEVTDVHACKAMYENEEVNKAFITDLLPYITFAIRAGWVKTDAWKRWVIQYNRLKLSFGG
jgi:hypothetical protein